MIDWSLLRPVDVGGQFSAGFDQGQRMGREARMRSALADYAANPGDVNAQNALAGASPEFAMRLAGQRLDASATAARKAEVGRVLSVFDTDPAAARRLAAESGDADLIKLLGDMSDDHRKQMGEMYKGAAPFAYEALKLPYEQRKAYLQGVVPQLRAFGWTDDQVAQFDPTDQALNGVVNANMTLEQLRDRDAVTYKEVGPGARLVPFDSSGRPVAGTPAIDNDEWEILPPEGGPTPNASGGFPR